MDSNFRFRVRCKRDKPIIARVNGHAAVSVNAGLVAGDGGAMIWPQLIGFARAKEYWTCTLALPLRGVILPFSRPFNAGEV
jgi:enoyl-CoA hydratase/carnithine racemase